MADARHMATIVSRILQKFKAPALPVANPQYFQPDEEQFRKILRIYFNQLDGTLNSLTDIQGGKYLNFPYGAFHQDGTTTLSTGITNVSTTPIVVASTASFPSSGWILIGSEIISYTTKTATTFAGTITRGVLGTTNVAHTAGAAISEVQGTGSPTTIGTVLFNNTDYTNGVYASADYSKVYFDNAGLYNIQLSVQLLNFTTTDDNVTIWLRKNGNDVAASAGVIQVPQKHGSSPGATIAAWNYFLDVAVNDYIQLAWASDTGNTAIATYPAGTSPVHPVSPALIFTVQFVSSLPTG